MRGDGEGPVCGWRQGGREGKRDRGKRERGEREGLCGGKVLNRVCRLVNITLTRSIAASGILYFYIVFCCASFNFWYTVREIF